MKKITLVLIGLLFFGLKPVFALDVCTFESFFTEDNKEFESVGSDSFECKGFTFSYKKTDMGGWDAVSWFAWSSHRDTFTKDFTNQYSAITKWGNNDSNVYCVAYQFEGEESFIILPQESVLTGVYITNTTYAYYSMLEGDGFAKRFGGPSGTDPDYFKLTILGYDKNGTKTGEIVFYLADFRFDDNSEDYILDKWKWVELSSLGKVKKIKFALSSTDNDPNFGMNTPAYFALDDFNGKEPTSDSPLPVIDDSGSDNSISCFISAMPDGKGLNFVFYLILIVISLLFFIREKNEK